MDRRTFLKQSGISALSAASLRGLFQPAHARANQRTSSENLIEDVLDAALDAGATYADVRMATLRRQMLQVQNDIVSNISDAESFGYGLRVFAGGNYGFAAIDQLTQDNLESFVRNAVDLAKARGKFEQPDLSIPKNSSQEIWKTPIQIDPFTVSWKEKIDFLRSLTTRASLGSPPRRVEFAVANLFCTKQDQFFASTTGTKIQQTFYKTYPNFGVTVVNRSKGIIESRSSYLEPQAIGYEITTSHPFAEEIEQAIYEAHEKASAQIVDAGLYDLIIAPSHLWYIIDETFGYHLDTDNIFGFNQSNPGDSLFSKDDVGKIRLASDRVSMTADNTLERGLASSLIDDEGNRSTKIPLIENGVLTALPMNQEMYTRTKWNHAMYSTCADGWSHPPILRIPNLVMQPDAAGKNLDQFIAETSKGLLMKGRGSILHNYDRKAFQVAPQILWLIENGKISRMVRAAAYQARVLDFWKSCTAVGGPQDVMLGGTIFHEKGEPSQQGAHSVSCPPAVFKNISVQPTAKER